MAFQYLAPQIIRVRLPHCIRSRDIIQSLYSIYEFALVSLEYEELRSAIRDVSGSQMPQLHEVARVLKHMATIAATDQSSTPVIDFEEEEKKLHVTDPFFAFYLRWGDLISPAQMDPT
jgi:hypothetical protein